MRKSIVKLSILERLVEPERIISFKVRGSMITELYRSTKVTVFSSTVRSGHTRAA